LLTIGAMGIWSVVAIFWSAASSRLKGTGTAGGFALINSIGGLGGFTGPYMIGIVRAATHSFAPALVVIAIALVVCGALAYGMMRLPKPSPVAAVASA
jgi:ACS family tartrate transporter-like MFS transporter